jgi:hypothetical protein
MKSTAFWVHHLFQFDTTPSKPSLLTRSQEALQNAGLWLSQHLCNADEPHVWKTSDRTGQITWHTYDPMLNKYAAFDSEHETRVWLEERYNQPTPKAPLTVLR